MATTVLNIENVTNIFSLVYNGTTFQFPPINNVSNIGKLINLLDIVSGDTYGINFSTQPNELLYLLKKTTTHFVAQCTYGTTTFKMSQVGQGTDTSYRMNAFISFVSFYDSINNRYGWMELPTVYWE